MRAPDWLGALGIQEEDLPPWWQKIDEDPNWQKYSFIGLAAGYGLIAAVALIQLARIQRRWVLCSAWLSGSGLGLTACACAGCLRTAGPRRRCSTCSTPSCASCAVWCSHCATRWASDRLPPSF